MRHRQSPDPARLPSFRLLLTSLVLLAVLTACGYSPNSNYVDYTAVPQPYMQQGDAAATPTDAPEFNTEEYDRIVENEFMTPLQAPYSTFSIDVDAAAYANMRRFINNSQLPPRDAVRTEELVNYFNYTYPQPGSEHPFSINTELSDCPWAPGHKLVHIGLQGREIPTDNLPPSNLVFLIDASGSMQSHNKMPLLKQAFAMLVDRMRPSDRVSLVTYANGTRVVLPSTSANEKWKILEAIESLTAGGGTAGGAGIKLAYEQATKNFIEGGNNRVILATDGDFNIGLSSDAALERLIEEKRETGVFLTVLGFGMGNYKDSKMQKLADKGNGNHAYIDNALEAKKVLVSEFGGTLFTIAKDVKIQVEFNPEAVKGYRLIGYENRLLAAEDFNDDKKDAGELGSGHTVTALYEIIPAGSDEDVRGVDPTRYQKPVKVAGTARRSDELMHVKFRYKAPNGDASQLIEAAVKEAHTDIASTSDNFRWSAAVAEFSLILRASKFKADASYDQVLELAQGATGADKDGYRAEFIGLVKRAQVLDNRAPLAKGEE